jgi:hypothetical protein
MRERVEREVSGSGPAGAGAAWSVAGRARGGAGEAGAPGGGARRCRACGGAVPAGGCAAGALDGEGCGAAMGPGGARRCRTAGLPVVHGPASRPGPVRPRGSRCAVRPREAPRPGRRGAPGGGSACRGLRRGVARWRLRRVLAGAVVLAAAAAAVVALGLLAGATGPAGSAPVRSGADVVVTAAAGETVWEVAARLAPGRPGPEVAEVAERIVVDNALESVRLRPGQVLHVSAR